MSDNAPAPEATEAAETATVDADALAAEVEKWKQLARKHEDRAKANAAAAKERDEIKQASMSEQEKAVAEAVSKARAETLAEVGSALVDAEFKAAAAGRSIDVAALLEGLDRSRFVTEDGQADTEAITTWIDRIAPAEEKEPARPGFPDLGQGQRGKQDMALNGDPLLRDLKSKLGIQ